MWGGDSASKVLTAVKEVYDQHLIIKTQFENLKDLTEKALNESRRLYERLIDKIENMEKEQRKSIENMEKEQRKSDDDLKARISNLEARLNAFSESAMRAAMTEVAEKYYRDKMSDDSNLSSRQLALTDGTTKEINSNNE